MGIAVDNGSLGSGNHTHDVRVQLLVRLQIFVVFCLGWEAAVGGNIFPVRGGTC